MGDKQEMTTLQEAIATVESDPTEGGRVVAHVEYKGLYIFQVVRPRGAEAAMDPFVAVDKSSGQLEPYSIVGEDFTEVFDLFQKAGAKEWPT